VSTDRSHAMDHVVLVLFENRSFDNALGHLYGPPVWATGRQDLRGRRR
jgi:phospholipase C